MQLAARALVCALTLGGVAAGPALPATGTPVGQAPRAVASPTTATTTVASGAVAAKVSRRVSRVERSYSGNWAGYVAHLRPRRGDTIRAWFRVPAVRCRAGETSDTAIWVGFGGFRHQPNSLPQVGVNVGCRGGVPQYLGWREWYDPHKHNPGLVFPELTIEPGQQVMLQLRKVSSRRYRATIETNTSTGAAEARAEADLLNPGGARVGRTAECIVEEPQTTRRSYTGLTRFAAVSLASWVTRGPASSSRPRDVNVVTGVVTNVWGTAVAAVPRTRLLLMRDGVVKATASRPDRHSRFTTRWRHR